MPCQCHYSLNVLQLQQSQGIPSATICKIITSHREEYKCIRTHKYCSDFHPSPQSHEKSVSLFMANRSSSPAIAPLSILMEKPLSREEFKVDPRDFSRASHLSTCTITSLGRFIYSGPHHALLRQFLDSFVSLCVFHITCRRSPGQILGIISICQKNMKGSSHLLIFQVPCLQMKIITWSML